ncbi:MAG: hypothetical protein J5586_07615 [Clostridia bacterium]|nr:hypothetical protein [Clostridia bacterium]
MKKIMSAIIITIMALSVFVGAAARPDLQKGFSGDALEDAEVIAFIPAGDGEEAIGFLEDEFANAGPESFAVSSGNVYVLDSVKNRIIAYESGAARYIPLNGISNPQYFAVAGESIYVVGEIGTEIISINGKAHGEMPLPVGIDFEDVFRIYSTGNMVCLLTHGLKCYKADPMVGKWSAEYDIDVEGRFEQTETVSLPGRKIVLDVGNTCLVQYLQHSDEELIVGVYEFVPELPVIETEYTVRRYDMDGRLLGCTVINNINAYSIPDTVVCVDPSTGNIYTMLCREEGVYITKPNFRMDYLSHMEELTEIAEAILESDAKEMPVRYSTVTSMTRAQVQVRAEAARDHIWVLQAVNKDTTGLPRDVTLPYQVEHSNPNNTMKGIPYCWGGGIMNISTDFDALLSTSVTGNINQDSLGHVPGTIGFDCSGFVSYAYGISKHNTEYFRNTYGHYVNGSAANSGMPECGLANITYMDFMVRYNYPNKTNHVLLYCVFEESTGITTIECTTAPIGTHFQRVKNRTYATFNALSGYILRTPYACGGTVGHTMSDYQYDSERHWKECTMGCGKKTNNATHTMTAYGYNNTYHWNKCTSNCGYTCNKTAHTWSGYQYNVYSHWKVCTGNCGKITAQADHTWVACNFGYRCSVCNMYTTDIPDPGDGIGGNTTDR